MRQWDIGADVERRTASYCLEEAPWWVFFLERFIDWLCLRIPAIPLPTSSSRDEPRDADFPIDNTRAWFHARVHGPLAQWLESHKQQYWIAADYEAVKRRHPVERRMIEELESFWEEEQAA